MTSGSPHTGNGRACMARDATAELDPPQRGGFGRVLVTGCAGFIGSHLCERLVDDGRSVIGVDCFTDYYARDTKEANLERLRSEPRFALQELDLSEDDLDPCLEDVDTVYHLAAQPGVRGSFDEGFEHYVRCNILATQRLLEAVARASSPPLFVYASSSSVYGDASDFPTGESRARAPRSPYGLTKVATEELTEVYRRGSGLRTVGLRYFTVYGPRQRPDMAFARFIAAALADRPVEVLGDGSQIRDFTFVGDAVAGTLAAARSGRSGSVYNIGGGSQVVLLDAIDLIRTLLDRPVSVKFRSRGRGDVRRTCSDPRLAARELHFLPTTTLHDGLRAQIEWALTRSNGMAAVARS